MKRKITTIVSVLLGLLVIAGIVYYIGFEDIVGLILRLGWAGFASLVLTVSLTFVFWGASWIVILRADGVNAPVWSCLAARLSSFAVSYLTPSMHFGGEPVRALLIDKETDSSYTKVFATIATERITTALALACFVLLGAYEGIANQLPTQTLSYLILLSAVFGGLLVLLVINFTGGHFFFSRIARRAVKAFPAGHRFVQKTEEVVNNLENDISRAFQEHRRSTVYAFLLNMVAILFMYLRPQVFFYFSKGKLFPPSELAIIFALTILLSSFLWITPGGLGISEGGLIGIFALVGVKGSDALAYSFSVKMIELFLVGFGLAWMGHYGILNLIFDRESNEQDT
ncbi:MAG: flippase-like domain-containing protein [Candidatus Acetothermia bacterium]